MASAPQIGKPGDIRIDELEINPLSDRDIEDIRNIFLELNIYEDLFSPYGIRGDVLVSDALGMPRHMPIVGEEVGEEVLDFHFHTIDDGDDAEMGEYFKRFSIHTIENQKQMDPPNQQFYTIGFNSLIIDDNRKKRVLKYYEAKPGDAIVKDIVENYFQLHSVPGSARVINGVSSSKNFEKSTTDFADVEDDITESSSDVADSITCLIPNWYPIDAIAWITERTISNEKHPRADYLFYETFLGGKNTGDKSGGGLHFRSLQEILKEEPIGLLTMEPSGIGETGEVRAIRKYAITNWRILHNPDTLENRIVGMYASKMITHDMITKKIGGLIQPEVWSADKPKEPKYKWNYDEEFDPEEHISDHKMSSLEMKNFNNASVRYDYENNVTYQCKESKLFDKQNEENLFPEKWIMNRKSILQQLSTWILQVTMHGRIDFHVGDIMEFNLPSAETAPLPGTHQQNIHEMYSGKYLVTSIRHQIKANGLMSHLELRKNAWDINYNDSPTFKEAGAKD